MAINNFSIDGSVHVINGRQITDWGDTDPPVTNEPIDPRSALRRGLGGNAVRLDRINPGRRLTIRLNPGSPDASFMQGLFNSKANITYAYNQIGTLESAIGTEGIITNDGAQGRSGMTITDNEFIMEFNSWDALK